METFSEEAILTTDRLWLRQILPSDAPVMFALNSDPVVLRYTGDVSFPSVEYTREFIENYSAYRVYGFGRWAVLRRADNEMLGWCGLKQHPDGRVDLGYRFFQRFWGRGYATEASRACVDWGFREAGLLRIEGRVDAANIGSVRVLEKVGMTFWKEEPCEGIADAQIYVIERP